MEQNQQMNAIQALSIISQLLQTLKATLPEHQQAQGLCKIIAEELEAKEKMETEESAKVEEPKNGDTKKS